MKKQLLAALFFAPCFIVAQTTWKPASFQLPTRWSKEVSPTNALPEYPRPQMVRSNWQNLNGLWEYAITSKDSLPLDYEGQILVPYPIKSSLSGVKKDLLPSQNLWYRRTFTKPDTKNGEHVLLQFGAIDWQATVFLNGKQVGLHTGGYQHFTIDITDNLNSGNNELIIKVYDPTDQGIGPHGKQVLNPQNIYYTASSGIWQTVWLEVVPAQYISDIKLTP